MGIIEILPRHGNFYKVNLHTHSTLSDGTMTPEQLKELYMANGYDAIAITDHRKCIPHPELNDDRFVAIPGVELDFHETDENKNLLKAVHLNAFPYDPTTTTADSGVRFQLDYALINQTIEELKRSGYYVVLNHPVWSNMTSEDIGRIRGFDAMEVCNSIAVLLDNHSDDSSLYECFLRTGGRAFPIAADDAHRTFKDGSPCIEYAKSFVMVKATECSHTAILSALSIGAFYASTGPRFENMWLEGDTLHIECSPVFGVFVHGKCLNQRTQMVEKSDCITHVSLDISHIRKSSPYFWVQLRDSAGKKAWAVPYWFEKD